MCATNAFLRSLGVEIYASGHGRWPDEVEAQAVAERLRPGATVNDVATRFGVQGYALTERLDWDVDGRPTVTSMTDYRIPGALDVPRRIDATLIEDPEPTGPFGAKEMGERGIIGGAPALANAIRDAAGIRLRRLRFLPERVLEALDGDGTDAGSAPVR